MISKDFEYEERYSKIEKKLLAVISIQRVQYYICSFLSKGKGKSINLIKPHPQPCQYLVELYNLTSMELTQHWCESSPSGDLDQHAACILYRASASAVLPYVCWY